MDKLRHFKKRDTTLTDLLFLISFGDKCSVQFLLKSFNTYMKLIHLPFLGDQYNKNILLFWVLALGLERKKHS